MSPNPWRPVSLELTFSEVSSPHLSTAKAVIVDIKVVSLFLQERSGQSVFYTVRY